jgi:hypothetical protein
MGVSLTLDLPTNSLASLASDDQLKSLGPIIQTCGSDTMLSGRNTLHLLCALATICLLILAFMTNGTFASSETQNPIDASVDEVSAAERAGKLIGVLEYDVAGSRNSHYIIPEFSNYFHRGDTIALKGFITQVGDWHRRLNNAMADVSVHAPDGSIIFEKKNIRLDEANRFGISISIGEDYPYGKYYARAIPAVGEEGLVRADNDYVTQFFVLRNSSFEIGSPDVPGEYLDAYMGSVQYEASSLQMDPDKRELSISVERISPSGFEQTYSNETQLDYAGDNIFIVVDKRIRDGPYKVWVDERPVGSGWLANDRFSMITINLRELGNASTIRVAGYK